jgi:hypothetical protein
MQVRGTPHRRHVAATHHEPMHLQFPLVFHFVYNANFVVGKFKIRVCQLLHVHVAYAYMYIYIYTYIYVHYMYTYVGVYVNVIICVCVCACSSVCVYVHAYEFVHAFYV